MVGIVSLTVAALVGGCGGSGGAGNLDGGGQEARGDGKTDASLGRCDPFPPCLESARACALVLPCTVQSSPTSFAACFSNGVKLVESADGTAITLRFSRDGNLCATETLEALDGGSGNRITYTDPSGATLATGTQASSGALTISCGGQTYDLDFSGCAADGGTINPERDCQQGVCQ